MEKKVEMKFNCISKFNCVVLIISLSAMWPLTASVCPAGYTGPACNRYDYAYLKGTSQKEYWVSHSSHYAVDGNVTSCTLMNPVVDNPWWEVDLGKNMYIDGVELYVEQQTLAAIDTYTVEIQKDDDTTWSMCLAYSGGGLTQPIRVICQSRLEGRRVKFTAYRNLSLGLCDVGVYGACVSGSYGNYCEQDCGNCKNGDPCNTVTGACASLCDIGWYGATCKDECPHGTYGDRCSLRCGHCQYNITCNRFDGTCPNNGVCDPGYQSPMCQQLCPDGKWGDGCVDCGACKYGQPCEKINGTCMQGCAPGYKPALIVEGIGLTNPYCNITCDSGWYGTDCAYECGKCNDGTVASATCNITTGQCDLGCAPGYLEDSNVKPPSTQCRAECGGGLWGLNCRNTCGKCAVLDANNTLVSAPCIKEDGSCPFLCLPGNQGVKCVDTCTPGTYGASCNNVCGKCLSNAACDKLNGTCPGDCDNGYLGNKCDQVCPEGRFGFKCQGTCPVNCQSVCSNVDGSCICKDGWTGPSCQDVCSENHYGKDCKLVCGNCKPGTTCNQGTGECPQGCAEEWTGLKCDAKKIIEVLEKSYGDIIGGTIGGVIALALITVFVVWVVWRYKKDKSIHIKELAASIGHSVRRLSIRGRDSLRRSIQRLSMRGRRQHDQQKLGKNAEGPAQSNGTRGQRKHVARMYECVKLHSNQIHYDDFMRIYLQLQEATPDGRTLLFDSFQSFLAQRPQDKAPVQNGHPDNKSYYNVAVEDVQLEINSDKSSKIPAFLPLGANLSGFLLINAPAASEILWNHLQQRQLETIISVGKEASFAWRPGERITIGPDVVECIDVQLHPSHRETKLFVQRMGTRERRPVRHLECFIWNEQEKYPLIPTLLMFIERFQQIHYTQRERTVLVNYLNLHDQAILFTLVASELEILMESKRADILRTVAIGGNATSRAVRTFDEFKYLHDVIFQYIIAMENRHGSTAI